MPLYSEVALPKICCYMSWASVMLPLSERQVLPMPSPSVAYFRLPAAAQLWQLQPAGSAHVTLLLQLPAAWHSSGLPSRHGGACLKQGSLFLSKMSALTGAYFEAG